MTARPETRRRSVQVGGALVAACFVAVLVVGVVAVTTLRASKAGRAPEVDTRQVAQFPDTPNAVIGVVDDLDRLASLAVLTLDPSGIGGSVVVIPVNVDSSDGFGPQREPISRQPFVPGDEEGEARLIRELEPLLTLTIERSLVVGPDELAEFLEPIAPVEVDLPERVVDSDTPGSGFIAAAGVQELELDQLVAAFTAISADGTSYSHHDLDVALWSAVATQASGAGVDVEVPTDEFGRPLPPDGVSDLISRLVAGEVTARDLETAPPANIIADNVDDADFVLIDRLDSVLVFGAISPRLVTTPNNSLVLRLVVHFGDDQMTLLGDDANGDAITKAAMTRQYIGELLFAGVNVVAVDLSDDPDSVPETTRLIVTDDDFEDDLRAVSTPYFDAAELVVADQITDNANAVVVLGLDYLERRREVLDEKTAEAEDATATDSDPDNFPDPTVDPDPATVTDDEGQTSALSTAPSDTVGSDG